MLWGFVDENCSNLVTLKGIFSQNSLYYQLAYQQLRASHPSFMGINVWSIRPHTSHAPLVIALVPLKCSSGNLKFPLSRTKCLVSLPFKKRSIQAWSIYQSMTLLLRCCIVIFNSDYARSRHRQLQGIRIHQLCEFRGCGCCHWGYEWAVLMQSCNQYIVCFQERRQGWKTWLVCR